MRPYVRLLLRNWLWIVGSGLVLAALVFGVASLLPPQYEATALVAVTEPRYVLQFDPRFETVENTRQAYAAYPELATSDEMMQKLLDELAPRPGGIADISALRNLLSANQGADPSLIRLTVTTNDPAASARVANTWVELFMKQANRVYGSQGEEQVAEFEQQLAQAESELEVAEERLIAFEQENRVSILTNRLEALLALQADYLAREGTLSQLEQDIAALQARLEQQTGTNALTLADQLTAISLQLKAFDAETETLYQFQIGGIDEVAEQSVAEQIAFLESLAEVSQAHLQEIEVQLADLEPRILTVQEALQAAEVRASRLRNEWEIAQETMLTLARKVEETRVAARAGGGAVQLASRAAVPEDPAGPRRLLFAVVGGTIGCLFAVFVVFAIAWWRDEDVLLTDEIAGG